MKFPVCCALVQERHIEKYGKTGRKHFKRISLTGDERALSGDRTKTKTISLFKITKIPIKIKGKILCLRKNQRHECGRATRKEKARQQNVLDEIERSLVETYCNILFQIHERISCSSSTDTKAFLPLCTGSMQ